MTSARRYDAVLCAVDGVVRVWDDERIAEIERRHGLPAGALRAAVTDPPRLAPALVGRISDEQWRTAVAGALVPLCGGERAIEAVSDWSASMGRVDEAALDVLRAARKAVPVALVANATTRLELELVVLGLADEVDAVVSSARLGTTAPDPEFYRTAAGLAGAAPQRCLYIDTDAARVAGAERIGMTAALYAGADHLAAVLGGRTGD